MKQPKIRSKYNSKESFSFEEAPSEFKSVTEKSIKDIKNYCHKIIDEEYHNQYDPQALYAMVGSIIGNFDLLTSRLNEDYNCRRSKLKKTQNLGIKRVNEKILNFEKSVADREASLKRYGDNLKEYDGNDFTEALRYDMARLEKFKKRQTIIEEKNHEA